jgi:glutaminyl-peptide cyclotransferase
MSRRRVPRLPARAATAALTCVLLVAVLAGCSTKAQHAASGATGPYEVIERVDHATDAFTEGWCFVGDRLFESVGLTGHSEVREVNPRNGAILKSVALPADEFGEGLACTPDGLTQLTWQSGRVFRWSLDLVAGPGGMIEGEGWGLTTDGTSLYQSDGSAQIQVRDPKGLGVQRVIRVSRDGKPVEELNELEWIDGRLWANVWHSTEIVRIDPATGLVDRHVDLSALVPNGLTDADDVLNGIAHQPGDPVNQLWVTGKRWPTAFKIRLSEP